MSLPPCFIPWLLVEPPLCLSVLVEARLHLHVQHDSQALCAACADPALPGHSLVAVFDGHGGSRTAAFAKAHLLSALSATREYKSYVT